MSDILIWIQRWYTGQCDGDWEHHYGVSVTTLDNPGWKVSIDLVETGLEGKDFKDIKVDRADDDWIVCHIEEAQGWKKFVGYGGPRNLIEIFEVFHSWVESVPRDS